MKRITILTALAITFAVIPALIHAQTGYLYVFDDSQPGIIRDGSGHGHDIMIGSQFGSDLNDPVLEDDSWNPGMAGDRWLRFDGEDDYAYGATFERFEDKFTLECRFTLGQNAALFGSQVLISTKGYNQGGYELRIDSVMGTPNMTFVWFDAAGNEYAVRGGCPDQFNRTYHAVVVYFHKASITTAVLYLDGVALGVTSIIGGKISYEKSWGIYLGRSRAGTRINGPKDAFKGTLDDIRLEHTEMDSTQVYDRYTRHLNAVLDWGGDHRLGGTLFMGPHCPGEVNRTYVLLLSLTPATGESLPGADTRTVPVGIDALTLHLIGGSPLGTGIHGTLIDAGWGFGTFRIPTIPGLSGTRIYGAFAILDPNAPNGIRRLSLPTETVVW